MRTVLLILLVLTFSCSKSINYPNYLTTVSGYMNSYVKMILRGNNKLADSFFKKAEKELLLADDNCNLSRIYIKRFFTEEEFSKKAIFYLDKAGYFANLDKCVDEKIIVKGLRKKSVKNQVSNEFYNNYFKYLTSGNEVALVKYLQKSKVPDYVKSKIYRQLARDNFKEGYGDVEYYINKAYRIDKFNGYSKYLIEDLDLMREICKKNGKICNKLDKRKAALEKMIKINHGLLKN